MIVRLEDVPEEAQPARSLVLRRVINADEHTRALSVTWARIDGPHDRVVNNDSDRVYYVIEGAGRFQVGEGAPIEDVRATDSVFIPRGVPYEFDGAMTYLVINGPAFMLGADAVLPSVFTDPEL